MRSVILGGRMSGNASGVTVGWQPRILVPKSRALKSSQQTGQHNLETEIISSCKGWKSMNKHYTSRHTTKYLKTLSQKIQIGVGIRLSFSSAGLQKRGENCLTVHAQNEVFSLAFDNSTKSKQTALGFTCEPMPSHNLVF
jgi:hypothetical protein